MKKNLLSENRYNIKYILQAYGFLTKASNGVWMISPDIMIKGSESKRQMLVRYKNEE